MNLKKELIREKPPQNSLKEMLLRNKPFVGNITENVPDPIYHPLGDMETEEGSQEKVDDRLTSVEKAYLAANKTIDGAEDLYHTGNKPSADDIGLGNLTNPTVYYQTGFDGATWYRVARIVLAGDYLQGAIRFNFDYENDSNGDNGNLEVVVSANNDEVTGVRVISKSGQDDQIGQIRVAWKVDNYADIYVQTKSFIDPLMQIRYEGVALTKQTSDLSFIDFEDDYNPANYDDQEDYLVVNAILIPQSSLDARLSSAEKVLLDANKLLNDKYAAYYDGGLLKQNGTNINLDSIQDSATRVGITKDHYLALIANKTVDGVNYLYHEGNKPTEADVGLDGAAADISALQDYTANMISPEYNTKLTTESTRWYKIAEFSFGGGVPAGAVILIASGLKLSGDAFTYYAMIRVDESGGDVRVMNAGDESGDVDTGIEDIRVAYKSGEAYLCIKVQQDVAITYRLYNVGYLGFTAIEFTDMGTGATGSGFTDKDYATETYLGQIVNQVEKDNINAGKTFDGNLFFPLVKKTTVTAAAITSGDISLLSAADGVIIEKYWIKVTQAFNNLSGNSITMGDDDDDDGFLVNILVTGLLDTPGVYYFEDPNCSDGQKLGDYMKNSCGEKQSKFFSATKTIAAKFSDSGGSIPNTGSFDIYILYYDLS